MKWVNSFEAFAIEKNAIITLLIIIAKCPNEIFIYLINTYQIQKLFFYIYDKSDEDIIHYLQSALHRIQSYMIDKKIINDQHFIYDIEDEESIGEFLSICCLIQ